MDDLPTVKAGVVLIDKDGYALVIRQKGNNIWSIPRGSVKVGEELYYAACREMLEESGVDVKGLPIQDILYFCMHDNQITHYIILSNLSRKEIKVFSDEISRYWWVKWSVWDSMKNIMKQGRVNYPTCLTLTYLAVLLKNRFSKVKTNASTNSMISPS